MPTCRPDRLVTRYQNSCWIISTRRFRNFERSTWSTLSVFFPGARKKKNDPLSAVARSFGVIRGRGKKTIWDEDDGHEHEFFGTRLIWLARQLSEAGKGFNISGLIALA